MSLFLDFECHTNDSSEPPPFVFRLLRSLPTSSRSVGNNVNKIAAIVVHGIGCFDCSKIFWLIRNFDRADLCGMQQKSDDLRNAQGHGSLGRSSCEAWEEFIQISPFVLGVYRTPCAARTQENIYCLPKTSRRAEPTADQTNVSEREQSALSEGGAAQTKQKKRPR